jgi:hypothetical protein
MAQTPLKAQPWRAQSATVELRTASSKASPPRATATLKVPGLDLREARVVWEAPEREPTFGPVFSFTPAPQGTVWLEAEAQWPDGRRVVAVTNVSPAAVLSGN